MTGKGPLPDLIRNMRDHNIGRLLMKASRAYSERAMVALRQRGHAALSLTHTAVLPHIELGGTRLTLLAERAGMTKQSVSQLVRELETAGYVTRTLDPDDARASRIDFTALGQRFLEDAYAVKVEIESEIIETIGARETAHLRQLLIDFPKGPSSRIA